MEKSDITKYNKNYKMIANFGKCLRMKDEMYVNKKESEQEFRDHKHEKQDKKGWIY